MAETDFEAPLVELQKQIEELAKWPGDPAKDREARRLREALDAQRREVYAKLTPWQKTLVARHPNRPYTLDYVQALFTEWTELHGDRRFGDDPALVCGFALYHDVPVVHRRPPEGPRHQAEDPPQLRHAQARGLPQGDAGDGARGDATAARSSASSTRRAPTPGLDAEERGQAEAIAWNLREMARLATPIVVTVTGEGGSGGALAIAVGDRVNMLEHSVYSVISPEGCASILFRDASRAEQAAAAMKITAARPAGDGPRRRGDRGAGRRRARQPRRALQERRQAAVAPAPGARARSRAERLAEERYRKFRDMGREGREFKQASAAEAGLSARRRRWSGRSARTGRL